jgi:hypothetical protein
LLAPDGARQLIVMWRNIERLIPYARNARTHSDAQIAQIAGSIREFGFTNPVLIDEKGGLIAGHGRVLGARQLGMTQVPTITLTGLTEVQRRAYVIADNKLALNAGWDPELLRLELGELKALWAFVEWSEKRQQWCIEDSQGRCLTHAADLRGTADSKQGATELATAMIRDGRVADHFLPQPRLPEVSRRAG